MIFEIVDAVFAAALDGRLSSLDLLKLLDHGWDGPHRILVDPGYEPRGTNQVNQWLAQLSPIHLREAAELALAEGPLLDSGWRMDIEIRVDDVREPEWDSAPIVLPLGHALRLAQRPLQVVVEDWQHDGAFLHHVCPDAYRKKFEQALEERWVHIENGGGVTGIQRRVEELEAAAGLAEKRLRVWLMFDSDAKEPGGTDDETSRLEKLCKRKGVPYHRLVRRAIENYLPLAALDGYTSKGATASLRARYEAFRAMDLAQRCHFHMKGGFRKDRPLPEHFGAHRDNAALQEGFGGNLWSKLRDHKPPIFPDKSFVPLWGVDDGIGDTQYDPANEAHRLMLGLLQRL